MQRKKLEKKTAPAPRSKKSLVPTEKPKYRNYDDDLEDFTRTGEKRRKRSEMSDFED